MTADQRNIDRTLIRFFAQVDALCDALSPDRPGLSTRELLTECYCAGEYFLIHAEVLKDAQSFSETEMQGAIREFISKASSSYVGWDGESFRNAFRDQFFRLVSFHDTLIGSDVPDNLVISPLLEKLLAQKLAGSSVSVSM